MSFAGKLLHTLVVERPSLSTDDEYGQPARTYSTYAEIKGLPQPKTIREVALLSQGGAVVGEWTVFLAMIALKESDRIVHDPLICPMPGVRDLPYGTFEPTGIRQAAGIGHHLEVDARLTAAIVAEAS